MQMLINFWCSKLARLVRQALHGEGKQQEHPSSDTFINGLRVDQWKIALKN